MGNSDDVKSDWIFVFFGSASEYVLHPLFEHMTHDGFNCVEIDTVHTEPLSAFQSVAARSANVALVSSQHFHYGHYNRKLFGAPHHISLMEAAACLKARFICYCPHDLSRPIIPDEVPYLSCVDLYLAAEDRELVLSRYCDVRLVGWMKAKGHSSEKRFELVNNAIWLFSGGPTLCRLIGLRAVCDVICELNPELASIKVAAWYNHSDMESELRKRGWHVIDAEESVDPLLRSASIVFSNGLSSVVREASLYGKRTIVLIDKRISLPDDPGNWWMLAELPHVELTRSFRDLDQWNANSGECGRDRTLASEVSLDDVTTIIVSKILEKTTSQSWQDSSRLWHWDNP